MNNENIEIINTNRRRFCIGDIHGAYKALMQVLKLSDFDYDSDELICLGDVADSWSQVPECFDELLKIKNLVYIMGNHDEWLLDWFISAYSCAPQIWLSQGGSQSVEAYQKLLTNGEFERIDKHRELLDRKYYHIDKLNNLFVHGGYNWVLPIGEQHSNDLMWDRYLWETAVYWDILHKRTGELNTVKDYNEVFIGHTTTQRPPFRSHNQLKPAHASNVWNLDQGAGWSGKLTLMNIETKEYFQSDLVTELYPDELGRMGEKNKK